MTEGQRPRARSRAASAADEAALVTSPPQAPSAPDEEAASRPADRPTALRLARVHLRMGSLPLARAELESLAGRAMLDEDAMLDLAEVRWRTGDLAGAGEAANALLARGRGDALALVIAAESVSALGRPGEARRLAGRALEAAGGPLDPVFAGIPRSLIWPSESAAGPDALPEDPGEPIATRPAPLGEGGASSRTVAPPPGPSPAAGAEGPASTGAAEAFAGGRAALGSGDILQAAVRLAVALRLEPGYAKDVLDAVGDRAGADPALALVAGDALRLLGRESEALAAFDRARGHAPAPMDPDASDEDHESD